MTSSVEAKDENRVEARYEPRPTSAVGDIVKVVYDLRLIALFVMIVSIASAGTAWFVWLLLALAAASYLPLRYWDRWGPRLMDHPAYIAVELAFALLLVLVVGPGSAAFFYLLATALLGGLLYGYAGAAFVSALVAGGYVAAMTVRDEHVAGSFDLRAVLVAVSVLCLIAVVGAALRRNIDRRADAEAVRAAAEQNAAAADERTRLAREMHDSVAKTLRGVALQARALERSARVDPESVVEGLGALAEGVEDAADQTRTLISEMRADRVDMSLEDSLADYVERFTARTGVAVDADVGASPPIAADVRFELFAIVVEALANVEHHAGAERVELALAAEDGSIELELADDGRGFELPDNLDVLCADGHFGIVGVAERATRVGGDLTITSAPGRGTVIEARLPVAGAGRISAPYFTKADSSVRGVAL